MELKFRTLRADEIDCRVATVKLPGDGESGGLNLLLYKDARVDQNILDETIGPMNWQRHHSRDNANCTVSIWDEDKKQWVEKEDTGTESNTEAEKGLASDSFKRACFNWGIGRELYTAPFIWVPADKCNIKTRKTPKGDVGACRDKFYVTLLSVKDGKINQLVINNASKGNQVVFSMGVSAEGLGEEPKKEQQKKEELKAWKLSPVKVKELESLADRAGVDLNAWKQTINLKDLTDLSDKQAESLKKELQRRILLMRQRDGAEGQTA